MLVKRGTRPSASSPPVSTRPRRGTQNQSQPQQHIPGFNLNPPDVPMTANDPRNRFYFRDADAHRITNDRFGNRKPSLCLYYNHRGILISTKEKEMIETYIQNWDWRPFFSCMEPHHVWITQVLYGNMKITTEPFGLTTYYAGVEIPITIQTLCDWFGFSNEGEEVYPYRTWPIMAEESEFEYKKWYNVHDDRVMYASELPAVHHLFFAFLNNILTPKSKVKSNMEKNTIFFLKHMLLNDRKFNFPFIIISHMQTAVRIERNANLPYAHFLTAILKKLGLPIPTSDLKPTNNLARYLTNLGFIKDPDTNEYFPDPKNKVNDWIMLEGAVVNQYTDPRASSSAPPPPLEPHTTQQSDIPSSSTRFYPIQPPPAYNASSNIHMNYLCQNLYQMRLDMQVFDTRLRTVEAYGSRLNAIKAFQYEVRTNWTRVHGDWIGHDAPPVNFGDVPMQDQPTDTEDQEDVGFNFDQEEENRDGSGSEREDDDS